MITVKGKEFTNLKEAQDYAVSQIDVNEVVKEELPQEVLNQATEEAVKELSTEQTEAIDLVAQVDSLTDKDSELTEELDAALDEDQTTVLTDALDESAEAGA